METLAAALRKKGIQVIPEPTPLHVAHCPRCNKGRGCELVNQSPSGDEMNTQLKCQTCGEDFVIVTKLDIPPRVSPAEWELEAVAPGSVEHDEPLNLQGVITGLGRLGAAFEKAAFHLKEASKAIEAIPLEKAI
jgi:hypothetical protein